MKAVDFEISLGKSTVIHMQIPYDCDIIDAVIYKSDKEAVIEYSEDHEDRITISPMNEIYGVDKDRIYQFQVESFKQEYSKQRCEYKYISTKYKRLSKENKQYIENTGYDELSYEFFERAFYNN